MELRFTPEELAFRDEVRAFFAENVPEETRAKMSEGEHLDKDDMVEWTRILNDKGWAVPHWPEEYGGTGWDPMRQYIFLEELQRYPAPSPLPFGVNMVGPVIYTFGNEEQKKRFLPRIANLDDWWCQGFSEPGAGSDLASLKTRAVRDGDHYIVNGQKTWTTLGQHANWIFCLVRTRTDGKPQEGISFLLIDMNTPGISVRPIVLLEGTPEVNEVFFDDVRVPVENLVGTENEGWTYAKYLLTHERTNIAGVGFATAGLAALKRIARAQVANGKPLIENPIFAARIAEVEIELMAMATTNLRMLAQAAAGQVPGAESSMLKLKGTQIRQSINDLTRRAVGPWALAFPSESIEGANENTVPGPAEAAGATRAYLNNRKLSIYGGSSEVQRSIIAKQILGL